VRKHPAFFLPAPFLDATQAAGQAVAPWNQQAREGAVLNRSN